MVISVLDMFTIGIGPSSSHTVGPMRAAYDFSKVLSTLPQPKKTVRIHITLYGSLALTGKGHGTSNALLLGLSGLIPEEVIVSDAESLLNQIRTQKRITLSFGHEIDLDEARDVQFQLTELLSRHSNGMSIEAFDSQSHLLLKKTYYSIGGGFIIEEDKWDLSQQKPSSDVRPYPFTCGDQMLQMAHSSGLRISQMTLENEKAFRPEKDTRTALLRVWHVMQECVDCGCRAGGILPGGLNVRRRAPRLYRELTAHPESRLQDPLTVIDWVSLYAMAVNEENASGHRVVTAPTNGAAGVIPAVLHYYVRIHGGATQDSIVRFLLTAGALGILYKTNASISGAEVGCQGEVGVACSMAAGALTEVLGGTPAQVEEAAEIGMEHNLGLTCDPVGGLVQVPCIERNAMGAVKAINAARLALNGDGKHRVSLDKVIATMRQTGADMRSQYKETAQGGLAVNVVAC